MLKSYLLSINPKPYIAQVLFMFFRILQSQNIRNDRHFAVKETIFNLDSEKNGSGFNVNIHDTTLYDKAYICCHP